MNNKYYTTANFVNTSNQGRPIDPKCWKSGPCPLKHEKYYAWLKHRSQARFRGEHYELEWEDFDNIWSDQDFLKRGRKNSDFCLARIDPLESWSVDNCHVVTRQQHLKRNAEFRKRNDG